MATGTPIRLVQENGDLIELDAQSMVMTTSRKVGGSALPLTGSRRIGLDMNVNSAMINVQGIIADDREESGATSATALLNFGRGAGTRFGNTWATHANWDNLFDKETVVSLFLTNSSGVAHEIKFKRQSSGVTAYTSNGINSGAGILLADSGNTADPAVVATALNTYIANQLSSHFTSSIKSAISITSAGEVAANVAVEISQVGTGSSGNNLGPNWGSAAGGKYIHPHQENFTGGKNATLKSAGDKVQDIYGILNNSTTKAGRMAAGFAMGVTASAAIVLSAGAAAPVLAGAGAGATAGGGLIGGIFSGEEKARQDYICGIQIPYNSKIKASDGELYSARNFFMPTGYGMKGKKGSESSRPASAKFSHDNESRTGIQGAVQKMDITFDAGETVYTFNLIFAPIDNLL